MRRKRNLIKITGHNKLHSLDVFCVFQFKMTLFSDVLFTILCRFIAHAHAHRYQQQPSQYRLRRCCRRCANKYECYNDNNFSLAPH